MHCFEVSSKERPMLGGCRTIGAVIMATLSNDGLKRSHLQETFAAARRAKAARSAAAKADARIGSGDDEVVDQNGADGKALGQSAGLRLGPEDGRGKSVRTWCVRGDRCLRIRHIENEKRTNKDIALRDVHFRGVA